MANLDRPLAGARRESGGRRSVLNKILVVFGVLSLVGFVVSRLDFSRSYASLKNTGVASGSKEGNYATIVYELAKIAQTGGGSLRNVETSGSGDNVARLVRAAGGSCDVAFALAQDGSDWSGGNKLELIGRLPKAESVFFLGREADKLTSSRSLAGTQDRHRPRGQRRGAPREADLRSPGARVLGVSS